MADIAPETGSQSSDQNNVGIDITPSPAVKDSPKGKETQKEAKFSLEKLKEELLAGMKFELAKKYFDSLDSVEADKKPYILGGILSGLNQRGISIEGFENGKIILKAGIQSLREKLDIANHDETIKYQNLINNYLTSGKITIQDVNKALLYRTTALDDYLKEKTDTQSVNTTDYVVRLLEKYKIEITNNNGVKLADFKFSSKEQYDALKNGIKGSITDNQADKEFLIAYFDDIYTNDKKGISETSIDEYKESSKKIESGILSELGKLSDEQKYALGIRDSDDAKEVAKKWKNNPIEAAKEAFNNGGGLLGMILGIIGSIFWGKKGFFAGFAGGMGVAGGGLAIAGELVGRGVDTAGPALKQALDWAGKKLSGISNMTQSGLEEASFWFDFKNVTGIDKDGTKKELLEFNFNNLKYKVNNDIGSFNNDGKDLNEDEKNKMKEKINGYFTELKKINNGNEDITLELYKEKTLSEVIAIIHEDKDKNQERKENSKRSNLDLDTEEGGAKEQSTSPSPSSVGTGKGTRSDLNLD